MPTVSAASKSAALLTRMSILPTRAATASMAASMLAWSVTSRCSA